MKKAWIAAARFIGIGWYVGLCIAGGFFVGRWIGQVLDQSEAFFSLLGLAVGVVVAVYGIYSGLSLLNRSEREDNENEEK
ncbi:MAG: AtpZ/AtpI family protein [Chloroflexota bacterium]|nr:AtpZ/AtpI family protein [Chloroflexota bacterium]